MGNDHAPRPLSTSLASRTLLFLISSVSFLQVSAQSIDTSIQVPPLQWINLSGLLQGSKPQGLKDASIGFDPVHKKVLIFGGESSGGIPQSQTYLLDLGTMTWEQPSPPDNLASPPPARSAAISGQDLAASYRNGHVVIGGRGIDGPLSDVWEFDYTNQFWSNVSIQGNVPPARFAAGGGNDPSNPFNPETLANSFYIVGGFTGDDALSLSDAWQLSIKGTLASNVPDGLSGSWQQITLQNKSLPAMGGSATAVVFENTNSHVIAVGGCGNATSSTAACALAQAYVLNVDSKSNTAPGYCPAPRIGATLAPNLVSSNFRSQVFMMLGTFNKSEWDDGGGLDQGEVDIFNFDGGTWARVLPAGDPGSDGTPTFPSPREGAVAFSLGQAATGTESATDTIVFGGRDANGNYLNEVWLLRAYNGSVSSSNNKWSGYGNGQLQGGPSANGQGVSVKFLQQCASPVSQSPGAGSSGGHSPTSTGNHPSPTGTGSTVAVTRFDTSTVHKSLAPVSAALILPAIVFYRLSQPSVASAHSTNARIGFFYLTALTALVAFALGVVGLATAFTSLRYTTSIVKRSSVPHLTTSHGRAGIALFVGMYGLVPVLIAASFLLKWRQNDAALAAKRQRTTSNDLAEKMGLRSGSPFTPDTLPAEPHAPERVSSGDRLSPWPFGHIAPARRSSEDGTADDHSSPSTKSFEVTNRGQHRARHASAHSLAAFSDPRPAPNSPRNLSDLSWMERRRSVNTMGDIDYANAQLQRRAQMPPTPGTVEGMSMKDTIPDTTLPGQPPLMPGALDTLIHVLLHAFLLAVCVLSIIALWNRASVAAFAVFIAWTVLFYVLILVLAWHGVPSESVLTVLLARLRSPPPPDPAAGGVPFPTAGTGPYQHQPTYRVTHEHEYPTSISHGGMTVEDDDDDEDDDARQRRIEEEMSRRDVSIVTVPKRRLFLTNPEPS